MTTGMLLREGRLLDFANSCREKIKSASSKLEALQLIADAASNRLEEYQYSVAAHPDEISVNFIRLLDQVVFELTENLPADASVREYIIEDLYSRLNIYLDVFSGRETYACNLNKRLLAHDDTIVIRQCGLEEYLPLLVSEYNEQPLLQKSIIRCLLSFDSGDLLNFYYKVASEAGPLDVKSMALVGLKKFGPVFRRWDLAGTDDQSYARLVAYVKAFDGIELQKNGVPDELHTLMFVIQYIESNFEAVVNERTLGWIMTVVGTIPGIGYYNSFLNDLYDSLCSIMLYAGIENLKLVLRDDDLAKALFVAVDFLPREYFDRISPMLSVMGDELIHRVSTLLASGKIKPDERESNILGFMLWKRGNNL
jgi:hypothetical protein